MKREHLDLPSVDCLLLPRDQAASICNTKSTPFVQEAQLTAAGSIELQLGTTRHPASLRIAELTITPWISESWDQDLSSFLVTYLSQM
jgi:hypothetical protein